MKIAVLADIHSNLEALNSVLGLVNDCDQIFILGDLVGYGPNPNEVVEVVRKLDPQLVISGNHEYGVLTEDVSIFSTEHGRKAIHWTIRELTSRNLNYLKLLKPKAKINIWGHRIAAYHGNPEKPIRGYVFPDEKPERLEELLEKAGADILLLAHSHFPLIKKVSGKIIFNPGSVGQPRDSDPRASFGILEIDEKGVSSRILRADYNVKAVAAKIGQAGLPKFLADRLFLGI